MKIRDSGMPSEEMWQTFFSPARTLQTLSLRGDMANVIDLGCGYGTFTIPAALMTTGTVHAFDIEQSMIEETRHKAKAAGCLNINLYTRDFVADGTGFGDSFADYVMLFNLLHAEHPAQLFGGGGIQRYVCPYRLAAISLRHHCTEEMRCGKSNGMNARYRSVPAEV
ncbi:MAG: class I SAM-dependent methyltransferase [Deltaproteobacteria bacterium]|nr:class I SAM-dependent methyltransferase [Deltaproteobacteria bacterium]